MQFTDTEDPTSLAPERAVLRVIARERSRRIEIITLDDQGLSPIPEQDGVIAAGSGNGDLTSIEITFKHGRNPPELHRRKGMTGMPVPVQQNLSQEPFGRAANASRERRAELIKLLWRFTIGLRLLTKRAERSQSAWPSPTMMRRVHLSRAQSPAPFDGCELRASARPKPAERAK